MSTTLFSSTAESAPSLEPGPVRPPDYWNLYAVERCGCLDGWSWFSLDCNEKKVPAGYAKVEGVVLGSEGTRKQRWNSRDIGTQRVLFIKLDDFNAFKKSYAAAHGKCFNCWGSGKEVSSVHVTLGTSYRECGTCKGTGLPPA